MPVTPGPEVFRFGMAGFGARFRAKIGNATDGRSDI